MYVASDKAGEVLNLAESIMRKGIKYMDAAHLACAIIANASFFLTTDKRILKYDGDAIQVVNPIDFIRIQEGQQ